jgi:preprotein translocase subunit SecF
MEILKNPNFDFLGKTRIFVTGSVLVILAGLVNLTQWPPFLSRHTSGIRYGVEFSGGTQMIVKFQSSPQIDRVRDALSQVAGGAVIQSYDQPSKNQVLVRLSGAQVGTGGEDASKIEEPSKAVLAALTEKYSDNRWIEYSTEIVGPVVGAELRRRAITLTGFGLLFQLIYIAIRFKGAIWGAAATIAVFHDVLVTLAFLSFFGYEITLNVIAALLTLVGYSVNDTIVIFDRARENLRQRRKDTLTKILNDSVNQTLTRTLISNGTTFLAMLGLYLFGGEVLRGFGFTMVVGILVGTYSTIYIASPVVAWWQSAKTKGQPAVKAAL